MGAKGDLIFVILIILALGVVWVFTGGPERARNQGVFIKPPAPLDSGETYGKINISGSSVRVDGRRSSDSGVDTDTSPTETKTTSSQFENKITIKKSSTGPKKDSVNTEYITLSASSKNDDKIQITGWALESVVSGKRITIGGATEVFRSGFVNSEPAIWLAPGETVIIATGPSPIGASFRTNKCTGYLEQFQDFSPRLSRQCPDANKEFDDFANIPVNDNVCEDIIDSINRCEMEVDALPIGTSNECSNFISENINYTGCVKNHTDDTDFLRKEWRVFLGRSEEMWRKSRETIRLIDNNGKVVDTYTY